MQIANLYSFFEFNYRQMFERRYADEIKGIALLYVYGVFFAHLLLYFYFCKPKCHYIQSGSKHSTNEADDLNLLIKKSVDMQI